MKEETNPIADYLNDHPRMIGALFTLSLLLSQAGSAVAGAGVTID